jgi:hypothetical protein
MGCEEEITKVCMGVVVLLFHSGYRTLQMTGRIGAFGWKSCCCCRRRAAAVSSLSSASLLSSSWEKKKIHQHSSLSLLQCKTAVFDMHPSSSHEAISPMGDFPLRVNASTLLLCCDLRKVTPRRDSDRSRSSFGRPPRPGSSTKLKLLRVLRHPPETKDRTET